MPLWRSHCSKPNCSVTKRAPFTGATRRRLGRFELANEGSLFLDELANTSERVQEKVLRVIEYGELERVGGNDMIRTDVRIIGATNEDLPLPG